MSNLKQTDSYKFFYDISLAPNYQAEEISIFEDYVEENLFSFGKCPDEFYLQFVDLCLQCQFPFYEKAYLEQFSFQKADGIVYQEDKIMSLYKDFSFAPKDQLSQISQPHRHFSINYFLNSRALEYKYYDLDYSAHKLPQLPKKSILAKAFGVGVNLKRSTKDIYFTAYDIDETADFFALKPPRTPHLEESFQDSSSLKLFGLGFDATTLRPLKLKRYFYPTDPTLKDLEIYQEETRDFADK